MSLLFGLGKPVHVHQQLHFVVSHGMSCTNGVINYVYCLQTRIWYLTKIIFTLSVCHLLLAYYRGTIILARCW